jgi:dihydrofolate reductase
MTSLEDETSPGDEPVIAIVAGLARDGTIGKDGGIPWHYREDMQTFKRTTLGSALVMGRKTMESIGRLLPGRETIVMSRDPAGVEARWAGAYGAASLDEALRIAVRLGRSRVSVIGGGEIYALALPRADELLLTYVPEDGGGDTFFPSFDESRWVERSRTPIERVELVEYRRRYLDLQAHGQAVLDQPLGDEAGQRRVPEHWRDEKRSAALVGTLALDDAARPLVVRPVGDHELQLVERTEEREVRPQVALGLTAARALHVDDAVAALVDARDVQRAARLDEHGQAGVAEAGHEGQHRGLEQRLAAGHQDVVEAVRAHLVDHLTDGAALAAAEGELRVAPHAAKVAAGGAHEHERDADERALALHAGVDLGEKERLGDGLGQQRFGVVVAHAETAA